MRDMTVEQLSLRPERFYVENGIEMILGQPVTKIDRTRKVIMAGEQEIEYDALAITTGSSPRRLPSTMGGDLNHVYAVRSIADVDRMALEFLPERRLLVIGGGYIGLEAAAVAARLGLRVTLVEMATRILQRVASPETSNFFRSLHENHNVEIREGVALDKLAVGQPLKAHFAGGDDLEVDFAVVGIGVRSNDALAQTAGIHCDDGIVVNVYGQTSDPDIWAAGDCTRFPYRGALIRLESVQNAIDQAEVVAMNMIGHQKDYAPNPWFWSDQFDVKLQIAGLNTGYDKVIIRTGAVPNSQSNWYYAAGKLLAVDAMNDPRAYMVGKRLIESGRSPAAVDVANSQVDLKSLL
jgi:3-phenylpropionate/trans-cinnamate dioxygenase ferredoxin reductase subunit